MDLLSHALVGGLLASAGLHENYGLVASGTMVAASMAPDLDGVLVAAGARYFFQYHRGPLTHSLGGAVLLSAVLTAAIWLATPLKNLPLVFIISLSGVMLHLLSDLLVPWPITFFWPLSAKTFSLDLIYVFDPFLLMVLGASFLSVNRWPESDVFLISLTVLIIAGYLGFRVYGQQMALNLVRQKTPTTDMAALPHGFSQTAWDVIAREGDDYTYYVTDPFWKQMQSGQVIRSVHDERVRVAESQSTLAQAFLRRARFPVTFVHEQGDQATIEWRDVHLMVSGGGIRGVKAVLDERGKLVGEEFELSKEN